MATTDQRLLCSTSAPRPRELPPDLPRGRARAIQQANAKWVNGTVLRYYFFDGDVEPSWAGADDQKEAVREAFQKWLEVGIGLGFKEVSDRSEAELRIGFLDGDGSWSYIGRQNLGIGKDERTMNFGWDLTTSDGATTALHEIGHALGMPHEHQNPFAGIVWNEEAVYASLASPPNSWPRESTFHNILRKLTADEVSGSNWDPDSVMEYAFGPGMIVEPAQFRAGVNPPGTISPMDAKWISTWYPGGAPAPKAIKPFISVPLSLSAGQQADFAISPPESRNYTLATFGVSDTVIVLFEEVDGELRHVAGDDDSGTDDNASLSLKLFRERNYVLRVRLQWAGGSGETAVMYW